MGEMPMKMSDPLLCLQATKTAYQKTCLEKVFEGGLLFISGKTSAGEFQGAHVPLRGGTEYDNIGQKQGKKISVEMGRQIVYFRANFLDRLVMKILPRFAHGKDDDIETELFEAQYLVGNECF